MLELELMIPGPVPVSRETLAEFSKPIIAHYGETWADFYNETMSELARVFQTKNEVLCNVGSGTSGIEAAISSVAERGETLVVFSNGLFGDRLEILSHAHGIRVIKETWPSSSQIDPERAADVLRQHPEAAAVAVVHCESSSGVLNPVKDLAEVAHRAGLPILVDAVSSLGGANLPVDDWGIDVCVTASQKALQAPPGLTFVTVAPEMWDRIECKETPGWYLNLKIWKKYAEEWRTHHPHPTTMSTPLVRALRQAVGEILGEGLTKRFERHQATAMRLRERLESIGFERFLDPMVASPTSVAVRRHPKMSTDDVVRRLAEEHKIKIAGGLGPTQGQIIRIGNMGFEATTERVDHVASAIEQLIQQT